MGGGVAFITKLICKEENKERERGRWYYYIYILPFCIQNETETMKEKGTHVRVLRWIFRAGFGRVYARSLNKKTSLAARCGSSFDSKTERRFQLKSKCAKVVLFWSFPSLRCTSSLPVSRKLKLLPLPDRRFTTRPSSSPPPALCPPSQAWSRVLGWEDEERVRRTRRRRRKGTGGTVGAQGR